MTRAYYSEIVADLDVAETLDGYTWRWFDYGTIVSEGTKEYLLYLPDGEDVFFFGRSFIASGANCKLEVFLAPTYSDQGTDFTSRVFNRNADSTETTAVGVWQDPTITGDGTLIDYDETSGGTAGGPGGSAGSAASGEFIRLMPKDAYALVRITNLSTTATARFVYKLYYSEIPPFQT